MRALGSNRSVLIRAGGRRGRHGRWVAWVAQAAWVRAHGTSVGLPVGRHGVSVGICRVLLNECSRERARIVREQHESTIERERAWGERVSKCVRALRMSVWWVDEPCVYVHTHR